MKERRLPRRGRPAYCGGSLFPLVFWRYRRDLSAVSHSPDSWIVGRLPDGKESDDAGEQDDGNPHGDEEGEGQTQQHALRVGGSKSLVRSCSDISQRALPPAWALCRAQNWCVNSSAQCKAM